MGDRPARVLGPNGQGGHSERLYGDLAGAGLMERTVGRTARRRRCLAVWLSTDRSMSSASRIDVK